MDNPKVFIYFNAAITFSIQYLFPVFNDPLLIFRNSNNQVLTMQRTLSCTGNRKHVILMDRFMNKAAGNYLKNGWICWIRKADVCNEMSFCYQENIMNTVIMWIMAAGAAIGGLDKLCGNRLGLGRRFEEGFLLLGTTALSMAGIICLAPLLSGLVKTAAVPLWERLGLDPGILGGILAIDMGGYQLSMELAGTPSLGRYAGIVIGSTFGCTVTFTIPVGMGMISESERPLFAKGVLIGLGAMPASLLIGGLFCGLHLSEILLQSLPIFLLSLLLMAGIHMFPAQTVKGFRYFAAFIGFLSAVGLIAGAVEYMTNFPILKGLAPIEDAMAVVSSIGVVMLGSLPAAELLRRLLEKPLHWIGKKAGMSAHSTAGLLMGIVSPVPALAMMKEMDEKGKTANAAFLVCGASALSAHMGFTFGTEPGLVVPLVSCKLAGGLCALLLTHLFLTDRSASPTATTTIP